MKDLSSAVSASLAGYYRDVQSELHRWLEPLSVEQIWARPYPYGNSIGHLLLHVTGNLNYYIGAQIANTGYIRDRNREFTEAERKSRDQLLKAFDDAVDMVVKTVEQQSSSDWQAPYSGKGERDADRFTQVLRCAAHTYHHAGQIIYLVKELERQQALPVRSGAA